jgi:hypothetical protein
VKHAWALVLIAAAGCIDVKAAYPDRRFYTVEAVRNAESRPTSAGVLLRMRRFTASKMCDGSELVTRTGESTWESDFYNVLFVPPAQQLGEQTHRWLTASKLPEHVVGAGSVIAETHTLEGHIVSMHGDYRKPESPVAVLELQFLLVRVSTDPAAALMQKSYKQEIPIGKAEPEALVKGWSDGLSRILMALEADLAKVK